MADAPDSKSGGGNPMRVRLSPRALSSPKDQAIAAATSSITKRADRGSSRPLDEWRGGLKAACSSRARFCRERCWCRWATSSDVTSGERAIRWGRGAAYCAPTFWLSAWLLVMPAVSLPAQDSTFLLTTTDPTYRTPPFIGNGAFSLVGSPLGTTPSLSFAAGVYDHAADDVPRIAALPAWNEIDVSDGDGWLNDARPDTGVLQDYRQTLDLYDATLHTTYQWVHGARRTRVEVTAFVSRADPNLAVIRLRL